MIEISATREHAEHENFHIGIHLVELLRDGLNPIRSLCRLVAAPANVVRADHQRSSLGGGLELGEVSETPEDVVGAVAAEAKVQCVQRGELFLPDRLTGAALVKVVRD